MLYFQKFHIYLISDNQNIFHSLYMAMCQFGDVEKALFSRYDFNKSSVLFNRLHRTGVGGTFVQMACNRLNPLLCSFSFLQTVCTDGDLSLSVVIFFNPDLCICLFLKSLNHFSTRANHRTDTVAVDGHIDKLRGKFGKDRKSVV